MRSFLAALMVAGLLGCSSDPSAEERLQGKWLASGSKGCSVGVSFTDDDRYESDDLCALTDGTVAVDAEIGTYEADGDQITMRPGSASCADSEHSKLAFAFHFDGAKLVLAGSGGVIVFVRAKSDGDTTAVARYGCVSDDGTFTPGKLQKL